MSRTGLIVIPSRGRVVMGVDAIGDVSDPVSTILAAYGSAYGVTSELAQEIVDTAARLGTNPLWLANLIRAESKFNPAIVNNISGASGLIQFIPPTAVSLGTTVERIRQMSALEQMALVEKYLAQYRPLDTKQRLYLAVFRPASRNWPPDQEIPEKEWRDNPWRNSPSGYIKTPRDYVAFVDSLSRISDEATVTATRTVKAAKSTIEEHPQAAAGLSVGLALIGVALAGIGSYAVYRATRGPRVR